MPALMTRLLQTMTWFLIAAVTFATIGPPRYRPMTDLGQDSEHALAFMLVGLAVGLSYARRPWLVAAVAVSSTGILELMQVLVPGRHARLEDFIVDAGSLGAGLVVAAGLHAALAQRRRRADA